MISFLKILDAYTLRARLLPAVLAVAPALAALALLIPWQKVTLSNTVATVALLALLFALVDFARKQGLRIERDIFEEMGGKPSIFMFRRGNTTIDEQAKNQYRHFLAEKINRTAPTEQDEEKNRAMSDSFYEQAGIWLRANTRDAKKFPILWNELVSYGFRRNLRGLKWFALTINALVVTTCTAMLWLSEKFGVDDKSNTGVMLVFIAAAFHAIYFVFAITRESVKEAAQSYGRELILSCQTLMPARRRTAPKKEATLGD